MSTQQVKDQIAANESRLAALEAKTAESVEAVRADELALRDASSGNYALVAALADIEAIANGTAVGGDWTAEQRADERFCLGAIVGAARRALRNAGK